MAYVFRFILLFVLAYLVARAFWRLVAGVIAGASAAPGRQRRGGVPERGVQMVRDPICGTFLPPASALALTARDGAVRYFCSETCRDRFQAAASSKRS